MLVYNKVKPDPGSHEPERRVQTQRPDPGAEGRDLRSGKGGPPMAAARTKLSAVFLSPSQTQVTIKPKSISEHGPGSPGYRTQAGPHSRELLVPSGFVSVAPAKACLTPGSCRVYGTNTLLLSQQGHWSQSVFPRSQNMSVANQGKR